MNFLRDLPLKRKLEFVTLSTCILALALACGALLWFQSVSFRKSFVEELQSLGAIIAHNSAAPLTFDDKKSAIEVLAALKTKAQVKYARVYDSTGDLFASSGPVGAAAPRAERMVETASIQFAEGDATLLAPIQLEDKRRGMLEIKAGFDEQYHHLISLYLLVMAAIFIGAIGVILIVSSRLQRVITDPILALAESARFVSEKQDYSKRAPAGSRDEVGDLARTFNEMLHQIQTRDQRLRESQQRFEVAVLGSSDGLWDWDLITQSVYLSPRLKSMLGYEDHELRNELAGFYALLHPDDLPQVQATIDSYLAGRIPLYEIEFRARCKNGEYRWVLSRGASLKDDQGRPVRFAGSHTDITERKRTETEILQTRRKFESLVNSIRGVVREMDATTLAVQFISHEGTAILGYPSEQWLEDPEFWAKTLHPDDRQGTLETCRNGVAQGKPFQLEYRMMKAGGETVWLRESVSVEGQNDQPRRLRGVALDITEQKLAAEQIARMQRELIEASRVAGMADVATSVLHNVGNVLNSVNVSTTLVGEQLRKSKTPSLARAVQLMAAHKEDVGAFLTSDPKGKQLPVFFEAISEQLTLEQKGLAGEVQSIQQNIEHIKQIVAAQQSFAKVSGAVESLTLSELLEDAIHMIASSMSHHHIDLRREFDPVPMVLADRHKVLQILVNLFSNAKHALEHIEGKRSLVVRVRSDGEKFVRIEVSDNGVGIAEENLTRIFNHGFTTKKNGHGFGLHSGANCASEMGGSLHAQSDGPGLGATFILMLPMAPKAEAIWPRAAGWPNRTEILQNA